MAPGSRGFGLDRPRPVAACLRRRDAPARDGGQRKRRGWGRGTHGDRPSRRPRAARGHHRRREGPYDRGYRAFAAGDLQGAKQAFQEATRSDSRRPAPHYALGTVLDRLGGLLGRAAGVPRGVHGEGRLRSRHRRLRALSLASGGHAGEADTFLTDKQQKAPNSPAIATFLAEIKSMEGNSGDAQRLAQAALAMNPDFRPAMVVIAHDHFRARRLELANYALTAILDGFGELSPARDKDNPDAHLLRGLIEKESGQRAAAMADFDVARAKRPDMVEALIQCGVMKLEAGNVAEATPLLESAVKFAPNSPLAHLNLGDAYRLGARIPDAKKEFDSALAMDSSLAVVHYDLGLLYLFSPSVPGTSASDQIATALRESSAPTRRCGARAPPPARATTSTSSSAARTRSRRS